IGTADYPARPGLDAQGLPVYTLRCTATGALVQTTDPGRAMVTGKCADIGKFKGPILRALAARAPYFHNGSAATLDDVVTVYDNRFNIGFTPQEKADLVAFLRSLLPPGARMHPLTSGCMGADHARASTMIDHRWARWYVNVTMKNCLPHTAFCLL